MFYIAFAGKSFVPAPDVDVGLVHFVPRQKPLIDLPYRLVGKVTRTVFHHRQKFLFNNIKWVSLLCSLWCICLLAGSLIITKALTMCVLE